MTETIVKLYLYEQKLYVSENQITAVRKLFIMAKCWINQKKILARLFLRSV